MHEAKLREINNRKPGHRLKPGAWIDKGFDNAPPKTVGMRHLAVNAKKERLIEERCEEIERQNRLLLARMTQIMSSKGVFKRTTEKPPPGPRSLNITTRRKELLRIVSENEKILSRINSVQPQYDVRKWEQDFEKNSAIRESLSNFYPDEFGNDAQATDAMRAVGVNHPAEAQKPKRQPRAQSAKVRRSKGGKSEGSVRSATRARKKENETRLDRVLLVSRERSGRYAAERPLRATIGGRTKKGPGSNSQSKPNVVPTRPKQEKGNRRTGGRAAVVQAKASRGADKKVSSTKASETQQDQVTNIESNKPKAKSDSGASVDQVAPKSVLESNGTKAQVEPSKENESSDAQPVTPVDDSVPAPKSEATAGENAPMEASSTNSSKANGVDTLEDEFEDADDDDSSKGAESLSAGLLRGPPTPAAKSVEINKNQDDGKADEKPGNNLAEAVETNTSSAESSETPAPAIEEDIDTVEEEESVQKEERRWDEGEPFTKQDFLDFYGGLDEWDAAELVVDEDEPVASKDPNSTMGTLGPGWNMAASMKIAGEPLSDATFADLSKAVVEAEKLGDSCGGINETGGKYVLMPAGQALLADARYTAYTAPLLV